jgi:tetratricopeptide (TPR) repeat protein
VRQRLAVPAPAAILLVVAVSARAAGTSDVGEVSFPNSGAPAAQGAFLHGLAQLHNFEYESAAEDFRKAEGTDSGFAMAFWGEAMTFNHPIWMQQDLEAAHAALGKLGPTPEARLGRAPTEREKDYLSAVEILYGNGSKEERDFRYAAAMRRLHERYPDDPDAAAFYALSLLGTAHSGRDVPTYMRAAAIAEDVLCKHPNHPGAAHYLIHSTDDPVHAPLGLAAAQAYSKIAPNAAHAQHMCSHIFLALGMWDETVSANETALSVVNRERKARGKEPTNCGHYPEWLEYGYLEQGRFARAKEVLEECRAQAADAALSSGSAEALDPSNMAMRSFMEMRSRYLFDTEGWSKTTVVGNIDTGALLPKFDEVFASGYAAARRGDLAAARKAVSELEEIAPKLGPLFEKAGYSADRWERKIPQIEIDQMSALILLGEGEPGPAEARLRKTVAEEESLPFGFGPPEVAKPSNELLGEMLLEGKRPAEARAAFEASLARTPRRTASLLGLLRAQRALGDGESAAQTEKTLRQIWRSADSLPPDLASGK